MRIGILGTGHWARTTHGRALADHPDVVAAVQAARPCVLEPIVDMEISAPARVLGDVTGDLASRRGQVSGTRSGADGALTVLAAGDLREEGGTVLAAEYGVVEGDEVRVTTVEPLEDDVATSEWRHLRLGDTPAPRPTDGTFARDADGDGVIEEVEEVEVRAVGAEPEAPGFVFDPELAAAAQVVRLHAVDGDPAAA